MFKDIDGFVSCEDFIKNIRGPKLEAILYLSIAIFCKYLVVIVLNSPKVIKFLILDSSLVVCLCFLSKNFLIVALSFNVPILFFLPIKV